MKTDHLAVCAQSRAAAEEMKYSEGNRQEVYAWEVRDIAPTVAIDSHECNMNKLSV
jgi:hypothetical protein